ncbi:MAG TPA: hypothetical protein VFU88_19535 [Ktedonobacterales bacterium]|nr:hypothetical protein [Ktedonobacterales bacterium]
MSDEHEQQASDDGERVAFTHFAFTDETQYNVGPVRGLGMVSAPAGEVAALAAELGALSGSSGVGELKWEKVRSAKGRYAAEQALRWALERACEGRLRVDTLTWGADVARHDQQPLPHRARLEHMYRRLLGEILPRCWPAGSRFAVHPDEQGALRWQMLARGLTQIVALEPRRSVAEPLIQLADLFVGLAAFSRQAYATYDRWLALTHAHAAQTELSASDRVRCRLLDDFFLECKLRGLGVSLRTNAGLRTYDAARPVCFWWAETH